MLETGLEKKILPGSQETIPAAISDIGCEREINEDRYAVIDSPAGRAWVVCDGMGGVSGGDLAAELAIKAIRRALEGRDFESPEPAIRAAIEEANRVIVLRRQNPAFASMGTTVAGVITQGNHWVLAHAGDSRVYLVRGGAIQQLTKDHTYVQELVDKGLIAKEEAMSHPQAHVLTRCLGAGPQLSLDVKHLWCWESGEEITEDKIVICSDGLYSLVDDWEIAEAVANGSPQDSCVSLVEMARGRGGYDNITVAVLPVPGELRDEDPGYRTESPYEDLKRRSQVGVERASSAEIAAQLVKQLFMMLILMLIGGFATLLVMIFQSVG